MREDDALDARIERVAGEEQGDLQRAHGEHILGMVGEANEKRRPDPLIGLLEKAHQARLDAERGGTSGGDEAA
jgi:hypothetical protein